MRAILLVENRGEQAGMFKELLQKAGVLNPLIVASDLGEAQDVLFKSTGRAHATKSVGAVFLNLHLPDCHSFALLQWVQSQPFLKDILRVALVERSRLKEVVRAYELGAHTFLVAPPHPDDLIRLLKAFPGRWAFSQD